MTLDPGFLQALTSLGDVKLDESLSRHTTIGIGGLADAYFVASSAAQLSALLRLCQNSDTPFFILGSGSNIVVGDRGIRGLTIENKTQAQTPDRKSTRLNSSHSRASRMPSSA